MHGNWLDKDRFLHLLGNPWYKLLAELQSFVSVETYRYWDSQSLKTMHLPVTTNAVSSPMGLGSDSLPVKIDLFGIETYLADSMQFMLEYGCRFFDEGSYYVMPSFRGENASKRHLCQFYHSEIEVPVDLKATMALAEGYIKHLAKGILDKFSARIAEYSGDISHLEQLVNHKGHLPRVTFDEAAEILNHDPAYIEVNEGGWRTITHAGERKIIEHFKGFAWVTHYDHLSVPFYQAYADQDRKTAACADLLFGLGEIIGLGERHETADQTLDALELHQVPAEDYRWYVEMKRKTPMKTSGFGMGVERFLMWVLSHDDIRDMQILARFNDAKTEP
ncbi:asparagine synthetase A [Vibrio mangrovi]|uniref:Asparagine synthetase A n=1 Tax=Vibrio mangrovi TaxID=474394 RepID=A0A1Y6IQ25_9VIBR|nr:asparagine synthetase A [Vibrio mangrovi]MDW6003462.1 asparagine synthetase A [Vibrio mangrovi]SMR99747.1 Asparagine--tRNA ligase [Vibrio mangrovi]